MKNKTPAEKAWESMRSKSPAVKAHYATNRQTAAKKVAARIKAKQWEPEKVKYLHQLRGKATPNTCVVCGDSRPFVLQIHHVDPKREIEVILCANCHDIVRRSTLANLTNAYKRRIHTQTNKPQEPFKLTFDQNVAVKTKMNVFNRDKFRRNQ
jgi:hypothetical protein